MFKVVKTLEDGVTFVTTVPGAWETNNFLSWPLRPNTIKLMMDKDSVPGQNWIKIPCTVLKSNFSNYEDAKIEEELQLKISTDSEQEESEP